MSLTLSRFSQEVDVATGSLDVTYFAIFTSDDGRELKLPISAEASQTLVSFYADRKKPEVESSVSVPDESPATIFSAPPDELDEQPEEEEEPEDDPPSDENAVPSL